MSSRDITSIKHTNSFDSALTDLVSEMSICDIYYLNQRDINHMSYYDTIPSNTQVYFTNQYCRMYIIITQTSPSTFHCTITSTRPTYIPCCSHTRYHEIFPTSPCPR